MRIQMPFLNGPIPDRNHASAIVSRCQIVFSPIKTRNESFQGNSSVESPSVTFYFRLGQLNHHFLTLFGTNVWPQNTAHKLDKT